MGPLLTWGRSRCWLLALPVQRRAWAWAQAVGDRAEGICPHPSLIPFFFPSPLQCPVGH